MLEPVEEGELSGEELLKTVYTVVSGFLEFSIIFL